MYFDFVLWILCAKDLICKEPFGNFKHWFEQARNCSDIMVPNAMGVATATALVFFASSACYIYYVSVTWLLLIICPISNSIARGRL